jgi:hypothetical protein
LRFGKSEVRRLYPLIAEGVLLRRKERVTKKVRNEIRRSLGNLGLTAFVSIFGTVHFHKTASLIREGLPACERIFETGGLRMNDLGSRTVEFAQVEFLSLDSRKLLKSMSRSYYAHHIGRIW